MEEIIEKENTEIKGDVNEEIKPSETDTSEPQEPSYTESIKQLKAEFDHNLAEIKADFDKKLKEREEIINQLLTKEVIEEKEDTTIIDRINARRARSKF